MNIDLIDRLSKLPNDILMFIALEYDMMDVISLCRVNSKFNDVLCKNNTFWMSKVFHDFGKYNHIPKKIVGKYNEKPDWKEYYKTLYEFKDIDKEKLNKEFIKASKNGDLKTVKVLLNDTRVDPSSGSNYAIIYASENGHTEIVRLLLTNKSVDPSDRTNFAISLASRKGYLNVVKLLLTDPRVDPSADNNKAVQYARYHNHPKLARLLKSDPRYHR